MHEGFNAAGPRTGRTAVGKGMSGGTASTLAVAGGLTSVLLACIHLKAGTQGFNPANPDQAFLLFGFMIGGTLAGLAGGRIMALFRLPRITVSSDYDGEPIHRNPSSWAERTEGWTRDPNS